MKLTPDMGSDAARDFEKAEEDVEAPGFCSTTPILLRHDAGGNLCCSGVMKVKQALQSVLVHSSDRPDYSFDGSGQICH